MSDPSFFGGGQVHDLADTAKLTLFGLMLVLASCSRKPLTLLGWVCGGCAVLLAVADVEILASPAAWAIYATRWIPWPLFALGAWVAARRALARTRQRPGQRFAEAPPVYVHDISTPAD